LTSTGDGATCPTELHMSYQPTLQTDSRPKSTKGRSVTTIQYSKCPLFFRETSLPTAQQYNGLSKQFYNIFVFQQKAIS